MRTVALIATLLTLAASPATPDARDTARFSEPPKPPAAVALPKNCGPRDAIEKGRRTRSQVRIGAGLSKGHLFEHWVNPKTGAWSIVRTSPKGVSCVLQDGSSWWRLPFPGAL